MLASFANLMLIFVVRVAPSLARDRDRSAVVFRVVDAGIRQSSKAVRLQIYNSPHYFHIVPGDMPNTYLSRSPIEGATVYIDPHPR